MLLTLLVACDPGVTDSAEPAADSGDSADTASDSGADTADTVDTARDLLFDEPFDELDTRKWLAADWKLGETQLDPRHARISTGGLNLVHEADGVGGWVGAELYTAESFHGGMFTARVFGPKGPGTICAFFFYGEVDGLVNEIDVELIDGVAWFAVYRDWTEADGYEQSATHMSVSWTYPEGFDLAAAHEYRMDWRADDIAFYVDGSEVAALSMVPNGELAIHLNHWTSSTWPEVHYPPADKLMCRFDGVQGAVLPR